MPVLANEPECFPADLLTLGSADECTSSQWAVFHTRPRAEKMLARKLRSLGIPHYLPQYERKYRRQRRLVRSYLPLFPGYLFVQAAMEERSTAALLNQVASVLEVPDQEKFHQQLQLIAEIISSGAEIAPEDRLRAGDRVEIIAGPFKGRECTVLRSGSGLRILIALDFLEVGASVEVETSDIRWIP